MKKTKHTLLLKLTYETDETASDDRTENIIDLIETEIDLILVDDCLIDKFKVKKIESISVIE